MSIPSRNRSHLSVESVAAATRSAKIRRTGAGIAAGGACICAWGTVGSSCPIVVARRSSSGTEPLQSADQVIAGRRPPDDAALGADHLQGGLLKLREITLGAVLDQ